jgi:hypothetical protein
MSEIQQLIAWVSAYAGATREKARADERGEVAEKVILVAIFAAGAIAIATIIISKFTDKANSIPTGN